MESDNAHKTLLRISKEKDFDLLETYLQASEPVEINLSSLPLVEYLHPLL